MRKSPSKMIWPSHYKKRMTFRKLYETIVSCRRNNWSKELILKQMKKVLRKFFKGNQQNKNQWICNKEIVILKINLI